MGAPVPSNGTTSEAQPDGERLGSRRRRDAEDVERASRERLHEVRRRRPGAEADPHPAFGHRGGSLGGDLLFALEVRGHVGGQLYSARCRSISLDRMTWREAREVEVVPSLYAADFSRLGDQIAALVAAGARVFQFDMGDGRFIPEITIGPIVLSSLSPLVHAWGGFLDCHLMVEEPERHFEAVARAGGDSVSFHVEAM